MFGEGHDYQPQYTAMSGDMASSLPVGIPTRGDRDVPYWSAMNCYNHKEVWVHPSSRWMAILADLIEPPANPPGPTGWSVAAETAAAGKVTIRVAAAGEGKARFEVLAHNLSLPEPRRAIELGDGARSASWEGTISDPGEPWVAVVIPEGRPGERKEVFGGLPKT